MAACKPDPARLFGYRNLNVGAMTFAPFWLLSNGFVVQFFVYLAIVFTEPPVAMIWDAALLFVGTRMSWRDGRRWGNDLEKFRDEQFFWSFLGTILLVTWPLRVGFAFEYIR